jgi:hypothetical protein
MVATMIGQVITCLRESDIVFRYLDVSIGGIAPKVSSPS